MSVDDRFKVMAQPEVPQANFQYWARMASWNLWEGANLLVGINPQMGDGISEMRRKIDRDSVKLLEGVYTLAHRACQSHDIYSQGTRPKAWLDWAKSQELPIPPDLEREVLRLVPPNSEVAVDNRDKLITDLRVKFAEQGKELAELRRAAGEALGARVRQNMLKLIIGMAVAGYRYDPKARRGDSVKDITNDLAKLGLVLTDDTIRKYLREGADLLPPQEDGAR